MNWKYDVNPVFFVNRIARLLGLHCFFDAYIDHNRKCIICKEVAGKSLMIITSWGIVLLHSSER